MDLKNCTPVLFVRDARQSRNFYENLLGLTVTANFGGLNIIFKEGLAIWQPMDENIILRTLGSANIFNTNNAPRFELCFETNDLDSIYGTLRAAGTKFLHEMNTELWGQRTVRFYDPDGHLIEIGEAMPVFLQRILEEERGNVESAAKRCYMAPSLLRQYLGL